MNYIISCKMVTRLDGRTKYIAPAQYHFDRYYTQDPKKNLFKAMRRAIKSEVVARIGSLGAGKCGLWEIDGSYVFIKDKEYAKRAQKILIKYSKNLYRPTAYIFCADLLD